MALTPEDREELKAILKPQVNAVKQQAEAVGALGERMAHVETDVKAIKETVEKQQQHCERITRDFAKEIREHQGGIAEARTCAQAAKGSAKEAKEETRRLSGRVWAGLILLLGILVTAIINIILWLTAKFGEGGN